MNRSIVLFDGFCNMCGKVTAFIASKDKKNLFEILSYQSERGKKILTDRNLEPSSTDSVILVADDKIYFRSDAMMKIFRKLGFPWSVLSILGFIPPRLRNAVYTVVAKNRYRLFGKVDSCEISIH